MIFLRITVDAIPEKRLELAQTLISLIEPTGREMGCLSNTVVSDIEDKNRFSMLEEWASRDDLDLHLQSHRFGVLLGTRTLLTGPPSIQIFTVSNSEGMEAVHAVRNQNR